jgi:hypothetical protein
MPNVDDAPFKPVTRYADTEILPELPELDADEWAPEYKDMPDHLEDKVNYVFREAAVQCAKKIVEIALGQHELTYAPSILRAELSSCQYIIEQVIPKGHSAADSPYNDWMEKLLDNKDPNLIEPSYKEV